MWQVATMVGNSVVLRPHVQQGGSWRVLKEIPLDDIIPMSEAHSPHRISITVSGETITTRIDGNIVDSTTDSTFARGVIGFRSGDKEENSRYDNVVVTGGDGQVLFGDDFATTPDPSFPNARIESGCSSRQTATSRSCLPRNRRPRYCARTSLSERRSPRRARTSTASASMSCGSRARRSATR